MPPHWPHDDEQQTLPVPSAIEPAGHEEDAGGLVGAGVGVVAVVKRRKINESRISLLLTKTPAKRKFEVACFRMHRKIYMILLSVRHLSWKKFEFRNNF